MRVRRVAAGEFKAKCLQILDRVRETREPVVVTKRGQPVARLVPIEDESRREDLRGSILEEHDLVSPIDEPWDADE